MGNSVLQDIAKYYVMRIDNGSQGGALRSSTWTLRVIKHF